MQLLANRHLIPIAIQPKIISLEQICYKKTWKYCRNFFFFPRQKQRPKTNLEECYQCSVTTEIYLDLEVCFSLVTY